MDTFRAVLDALSARGLRPQEEFDRSARFVAGLGARRQEVVLVASACEAPRDVDSMAWSASFSRGFLAQWRHRDPRDPAKRSFVDAAGSLVATLEGGGFRAGVLAAGGPEPWLWPLTAGVDIAFYQEVEDGLCLLSGDRVRSWGVSEERVYKAALSVLFYKTSYAAPERVAMDADYETYRVGDGFDAARALLLEMLDYGRARAGLLFAVPDAEELLFVPDLGGDHAEAFGRFVEQRFAAAKEPLSDGVFRVLCGAMCPERVR